MKSIKRLLAILISLTLTGMSVQVAKALDSRVVDVAAVTWIGAQSTVSVLDVKESIQTDVSERWKRLTSIEGSSEVGPINFQFGIALESPIILVKPMQCEGEAAVEFMQTVRKVTYERLGIDDWERGIW